MAIKPWGLLPTAAVKVLGGAWLGLQNGDTGDWIEVSAWQDRTVQVNGTWGVGGSVSIQGTNRVDKASPQTLRDPGGNALTFTADGMKAILELPRYIRPVCTAGDGTTAIDITLNARGDTF